MSRLHPADLSQQKDLPQTQATSREKSPKKTVSGLSEHEVFLLPASTSQSDKIQPLLSKDICHKLDMAPIGTLAQTIDFIRGCNTDQKYRFFIHHIKHEVIGGLSFSLKYHQESAQHYAMFSYWLGHGYQGKGYASKALTQAIKLLKQQNIHRFRAQVLAFNLPSQFLLQKCGFTRQDKTNNKQETVNTLLEFIRADNE